MKFPLQIQTSEYTYLHNPLKKDFILLKNEKQSNIDEKNLIYNKCFKKINLETVFAKILTGKDVENSFTNTNRIIFELTEKCNLSCAYCAYGNNYKDKNINRDNRELSFIILKKFLIYYFGLTKKRSKKLNIGFYGGEPLLKMKLIKKTVAFVENQKVPYEVNFSLTTNGFLVKKNIDYLVDNNIQLTISLDGDKNANSYRFNGIKYEELYEELLYIKNNYKEYYESKISFNAVLHNKNNIVDVYSYFKKNFSKVPFVANVSQIGIKDESAEKMAIIGDTEIKNFFDYDEEIRNDYFTQLPDVSRLVKFVRNFSGVHYNDLDDLLTTTNSNKKLPTATCFPLSLKVFVTASGKILPCEQVSHDFTLAQIGQDKIKLDFNAISEKYNMLFNKIKAQCNSCYNAFNCSQCIFLLNDSICDKYLNKKKYSEQIIENLELLENNESLIERISNND